MQPAVGEVYLCSQDSEGEPILLKNFKGVKISNICGGHYRAFVLEKDADGKGKIHSLHPPEFDEYDYTFTEKNLDELAMTHKEIESEVNKRHQGKDLPKNLNENENVPDHLRMSKSGKSFHSAEGLVNQPNMYSSDLPQSYDGRPDRRELSEVREDDGEIPARDHYPDQSHHVEDDRRDRGNRVGQEEAFDEEHYEDGNRHDDRSRNQASRPESRGAYNQQQDGEDQYDYQEEDEGGDDRAEYEVNRLSQKLEHVDDRRDSVNTETATKIYNAFDGKGTIKEIRSGKTHLMLLNDEGKVFSYGYGEYGVMGRGMAIYSPLPLQITNLHKHKITKVACGYQHCLALNDKHDVFSWGRGFEGQLGLIMSDLIPTKPFEGPYSQGNLPESYVLPDDDELVSVRQKMNEKRPKDPPMRPPVQVECCSFPRAIRFFTKMRLNKLIKSELRRDLECYSKKSYQELEESAKYDDFIITDVECGAYHSLAITRSGKLYGWGDNGCGQLGLGRKKPKIFVPTEVVIKEKVVQVSAGYAHTLCITREGFLYSSGLNFKYQLGFDDQKPRYTPERVMLDDNGLNLKKIIKIATGDYNSFALTDDGKVYSWGSGVLGTKQMPVLTRPKIVKGNINERRITDIYANSGNAIFFSPVKIISMKPSSGPSTGGTIFSIIGVGLCDMNGKQRIKFVYGHNDQFKMEVGLKYDESTNSYYSHTPNFEAGSIYDPSQWPVKAKISVTLDGESWFDSDICFLIYSSKIRINNINPKFASIEGGLEMCIELITDQKTMKEFNSISVGFQATILDTRNEAQKIKDKESERGIKKEDTKSINPMDIATSSPELTKPDWVYFEGTVRDKDIIFMVPALAKQKSKSLYYNLDVSLNGQQFLGTPAFFSYYKVTVERLTPDTTVNKGGTMMSIFGSGFIDSQQKRLRLSNSRTQRLIDLRWEKDQEFYFFYTPPISWLSGREDDISEAEAAEIATEPVRVEITISGKDWIDCGYYSYFEPKLKQLLPGPVSDKTLTEEAIKEHWPKQEPIVNPFEGMNEKEAEKKRVELEKKHKEELFEIEHIFRKPHSLMYIEGEGFLDKGELMIALLEYKDFKKEVKAIFKNIKKLGIEIPLIEGPPEGVHDISVRLSFNGGQDYGHQSLKFKYYCFNKETTEPERAKLMDAELKNAKKIKK
jgi:alpha-tubulin suppressor-like RCC1 family protein